MASSGKTPPAGGSGNPPTQDKAARKYRVLDALKHNGEEHAAGDSVALDAKTAKGLIAAGVVVAASAE